MVRFWVGSICSARRQGQLGFQVEGTACPPVDTILFELLPRISSLGAVRHSVETRLPV